MTSKETIELAFGRGLELKEDPFRIPIGNFLRLENMIFTVGDRLTKRNGYLQISALPEDATFITTFNENLTAVGKSLQAYSAGNMNWVNKGALQPLSLDVLPLIRSNTNQSQVDTAISDNGYVCTVYTDQTPTSVGTLRYMYAVADSTTGQNIVSPTVIPATGGGTITGSPRVFVLVGYFIIAFTNVIGGTSHLQYIAVSINDPTVVTTNTDIAAAYTSSTRISWDGVVVNNKLFFAYNTTAGGQSIKITYITSALGSPVTATTYSNAGRVTATILSMTADMSNPSAPVIWAAYYNSSSNEGYAVAVDQNLNKIISTPVQWTTVLTVLNIAPVAASGVMTIFYEISNAYSYDSTIPTNYLKIQTVTQAGVAGTAATLVRSVGLASKAFIVDDVYYFLAAYQSTHQPTYFLMNGSGQVISRIDYGNGGGYLAVGLPSVHLDDNVASIGYLIKDFITSQNTSETEAITKSNIYSQTGINLVKFTIGTSNVVPAEIGQSLHLSGGFLWQYDGYSPVEHNFFVWPDDVEVTLSNTGGAMVSQEYQYQVIYTWTDNQGNIHRSAPSIATIADMSTDNKAFTQPTALTPTANLTSGSRVLSSVSSFTGIAVGQIVTDTTTPANIQTGSYITAFDSGAGTITLSLPATATAVGDSLSISSRNKVTINIPYLRLTYKTANPVKIEIYRWSTGQQSFYQVTSITSPTMNLTTSDSLAYVDTQADNQIVGNSLLYTTGGVVENVGSPSFKALTLFDNRLFGIDAEDRNLLLFSKQVIEQTPVEMTDLFSIYVSPTTASEGSTGPMFCIAPMDDKLIIFKENALYYINGTGPDNTGANNQYSQPLFITSTVGCTNQQSIVFIDQGLMFQSNKGIWLLGRDLGVKYIGAPVETYTNTGLVQSAVNIPGTTQVRFTLNTGVTLMYDYFYQQWGVFSGVPAISATLYGELHTYLDSFGRIFQENPGSYLDGNSPVLMNFKTGWINVAGINGYQRIHELYFLGSFISPANIVVNIANDFGSAIQQDIITPFNYSDPYGVADVYGQGSPYGGPGRFLNWKVQVDHQKCQSFQISIQEQFDSSYGTQAGGGFTLSAITSVISLKKKYRPIDAAHSTG